MIAVLPTACTKCGIPQPLENFGMDNRGKAPRRQPQCKACYKAYREAHAVEISARNAIKYAKNREAVKRRSAAWSAQNKERRKQIRNQWAAENSTQMKAIRKAWVLANPEKMVAIARKRIAARINAARKEGAPLLRGGGAPYEINRRAPQC